MKTMKLFIYSALALAAMGDPDKCKIPDVWGAFRMEFDDSPNPRYGFENEGYYAYDAKGERKWRAFINIESHRPPERLEVLSLYKENKEYVTYLSHDLKPIRCHEQDVNHMEWYSHDIDKNAKWDGAVTLGGTFLVDQWRSEVSYDRERGFRYQTFSQVGCVPIRDDYGFP